MIYPILKSALSTLYFNIVQLTLKPPIIQRFVQNWIDRARNIVEFTIRPILQINMSFFLFFNTPLKQCSHHNSLCTTKINNRFERNQHFLKNLSNSIAHKRSYIVTYLRRAMFAKCYTIISKQSFSGFL